MTSLSIPFETASPNCDEDALKNAFTGANKDLFMHLAKHKAESLKKDFSKALIIGSDQALLLSDEVIGKGKSFAGAFKQLKHMSGKTAVLVTAVFIVDTDGDDIGFEESTTLNFKNLSDDDITKYLELDEPYDCAGSFKIEKNGKSLFTSIDTKDETAIQGLPLIKLKKVLKDKGFFN